MNTPIKKIVLKALSPHFIKSPSTKFPNISAGTKTPENQRITLSVSPYKNNYVSQQKLNQRVSHNLNNVRIKITKSFDEELKVESTANETIDKYIPLVNTPQRSKILRNGLIPKVNWDVLGKGSFGTVVRAVYKGNKVAMKLVENKRRIPARESNALKLKHPNIVPVLKVSEEASCRYAAVLMRVCSSIDLQSLLDNIENDLSFFVLVQWSLQLTAALKYCHKNGVLHLDMKPKNILVSNGECMLCDFGSSLDVNNEDQVKYVSEEENNTCVEGTVAYCAPERFCQKRNFNIPSVASDIYSLAITFWQMETRKIPYNGIGNAHSIIYAVVKNGMRPPVPKKTGLKYQEYQKLYTKCWSSIPSLRFATQEIENTLQRLIV